MSVLACCSNILERLVLNRCIKFTDDKNLLNEKQFGFSANHSTCMAIMLLDKINNAEEENKTTSGVYLDLSKAFYTVDHNILLNKSEYCGFRHAMI